MRRWLATCIALVACSSGGGATSGSQPAAVTADAGADTVDAAAHDVTDTAQPDVAAAQDVAPDVAKDVGLPVPATVPADLPPGVVAIPVWAGELDSQGRSGDQKLKLPTGTVSFLAVVRGAHPGFFTLGTTVGPDGTPYGKGQCKAACLECANRVDTAPATGTALLPSSSGAKAGGGTWHVSSCGFAWHLANNVFAPLPDVGAHVETVLFARTTTDGQVPATARVQLRFFFTGASGLSAAKAWQDPRITGLLAEAQQVYAGIGVQVEVVDVRDTEAGHTLVLLPEDVTVSGQSDLDDLFAQAAPAGGSAVVDVFFVDQLIGGGLEGKGVVGGVSGAIPGPAFYHGIPRAGIAIAIGVLGSDSKLAGRTLAHELGHFLGLWHPSERDGKTFDPLDDTPQCAMGQDKNGDGVLDVSECAGLGAEDVMFWFAGSAKAAFTPGQGAIVRGNPLALPAAASVTGP